MKLQSVLTSSILALPLLLTACDSGKTNVSTNAQSAQTAADDFAKTFQKTEPPKPKAETVGAKRACGAGKSAKKAEADSGSIAGIPKAAVEGVKGAVDATKNIASKAIEGVSGAKDSLSGEDKNGAGDSDKTRAASQGCTVKESSAANAAGKSSAPKNTQNEVDQFAKTFRNNPEPAPKPAASTSREPDKKAVSDGEIVGLPKNIVKGVKDAYESTKEAASEAADKVSDLGEKIVGDEQPEAAKKTETD